MNDSINWRQRAPMAALALALSACGGGDSQKAESLALDCRPSTEQTIGSYAVVNGADSGADGWSQCLGVAPVGRDAVMLRWTWDGSALTEGQLRGAVAARVGSDGRDSTTPALPALVSGLNWARVDYDIATQNEGRRQLAVEWLQVIGPGDGWSYQSEGQMVRVLLDDQADLPDDGKLPDDRVTLGGRTYDVYVWTLRYADEIDFRPVTPALGAGQIDILAFDAYLKSKSWMTGEEKLAYVSLVDWIWEGHGETIARHFLVDVR